MNVDEGRCLFVESTPTHEQVRLAPRAEALSGGAQVRGMPGACRKPQLGCEAAAGDLLISPIKGEGFRQSRSRLNIDTAYSW